MILPEQQLRKLLQRAIAKAYPQAGEVDIPVEPITEEKFGDFTSTVALKLAKQLNEQPRDVAQNLIAQLGSLTSMIAKAEVAGPGFINFSLKPAWIAKQADGILTDAKFGTNSSGAGQKILVEFISANPTGPMTLGNGRGAFAGDTLSNILTANGWKVWREYYLNDIGKQVDTLAESVLRRYWQQQGINTEYPDNLYQGEYVGELAKKLKLHMYSVMNPATLREKIKRRLMTIMVSDIQTIVTKKLNIHFNGWFRESALHDKKLDVKTLELLRNHDVLYTKDGATWFRTTAFGDDKDRVLIKADGEKTYFLSDVALRYNRFTQRGFDQEIIFLGADHHGYIGRLNAAMAALGFARRLHVEIVQLVRLVDNGQEVKMSKRAGTYVTLEELIDEVGLDVARFFFLMHSANTHMDFDLHLAKEKSDKNPVYYVQYAHARICSILAKTKKLPVMSGKLPPEPAELRLVKALLRFPHLVEQIGRNYEVHKLPFYAIDLATAFHDFYTTCRVIDHDRVWPHRLRLIKATKIVLAKALGLMGIAAPDSM